MFKKIFFRFAPVTLCLGISLLITGACYSLWGTVDTGEWILSGPTVLLCGLVLNTSGIAFH